MNTNIVTSVGSALSAAASSLCCWMPVALLGFGASTLGTVVFLEKYHGWMLALSLGLLAVGFYLNYVRKESCGAGDSCSTATRTLRRANRVVLWTSAVIVIAFGFFPSHVGGLFGSVVVAQDIASGQNDDPATTTDASCGACGATPSSAGGSCSISVGSDSPGSCGGGSCSAPSVTTGSGEQALSSTASPLFSLDDPLQPLIDRFNADADKPRVVALLSPTCSGCVYAAQALQKEIIEAYPDDDFSVLVVWLPMLAPDNEDAARRTWSTYNDPRVHQYWDLQRRSGHAYTTTVFPTWISDLAASIPDDHSMASYCQSLTARKSEDAPMWDFAAFYPPGVRWEKTPPRAFGWTKQISYYGSQPNGTSGTFFRDDFKTAPVESDWYAEVRELMKRLTEEAASSQEG